jgi:hypothetical protein
VKRAFAMLLDFDVFLWVSHLMHKVLGYTVSVVTLEDYLTVFGGSPTGAEGFHFLRQSTHVCVFVVNSIDNGDCSPEFSGFQTNFDSLLLFAYFAADAYVFRKPACWTDFSHCTQSYEISRGYIRLPKSFPSSYINDFSPTRRDVLLFAVLVITSTKQQNLLPLSSEQ